ncbi:MAG TPA: SET domain-containing protein-lysine N-methyltransferase [Rhizomicrobium sp.]|nr:SET domain-containing protein-lysine N-methyltransferase [Rhizomicrobium sp.]
MTSYLLRSWISPKLVPGKSAIHGVGVIATTDIARGEKLMEFGGLPISGIDVATELYRERSIWLVGEDAYLALPKSDPAPSLDENLNHSCDANSWLEGAVTLVARRGIVAGEEITLDQGTWNFEDEGYVWDQPECSCGSAQCRKTLTNDDWTRPDVQERYAGHFHPFLQRRIDGQSG